MKINRNKKSHRILKPLFAIAGLGTVVFVLVFSGLFSPQTVRAAQFGRPISDIASSSFTPTPIWSSLDESSPDGDTSVVATPNNGTTQSPEVLLGSVSDPLSSTGHIIRVNFKSTSNRTGTVIAYLYQNTTLIATSSSASITTSYQTLSYTLTGAEADSITDYSNLRIRATFNDSGGGGPGNWNYTWAELEVPDVPNFVQQAFRWRSDDGNETSGSSLAAENTNTSAAVGTPVRLRFVITNTGGPNTYSYRLEYSVYSGSCSSTWTTVPDTPTTEHFDMVATTGYTDQAASTNVTSGPAVISDPGGFTFSAGKLVESTSNTATSVLINQNDFTELEYALQTNTNATEPTYCFRVTRAGTALESYTQTPRLTVIYQPEAPVIYSPLNGSNNVSRIPTFQLRSKDNNSDYLRYSLEICPVNSWPCASGGLTFTQTAGDQTCWGGQNAQTETAYTSSFNITASAMAFCTVPSGNALAINTQYYFRARAIDPADSNSYGPYSTVTSFSTGILEILIRGGTNINGGTNLGG